jgi:pimeloyl-ACP methyl ester carboxylesterase
MLGRAAFLRGYGQSTLPPDAPEHAQSSKRAMAGDVVALMRHLGYDRFSIPGHDSSRFAIRLPARLLGVASNGK